MPQIADSDFFVKNDGAISKVHGYICLYKGKQLLLFLFFINLFIYFWLLWVFVAAHWLSLVAASRVYSLLRGLLIVVASLVAEHGF